MKLALGPIQYYWTRDQVFAFYQAIAKTAIDIVYLGEAVCSRRHVVRLTDWLEIAELLEGAGKQVVLSTMVLLESESDLTTMRKITGNGRFAIEANDMGAVQCLSTRGTPFVAGSHLNIYSAPTLRVMAGLGAKRWVIPLEMAAAGLAEILQDRPAAMETEVFAFGRMALAFSARCFTARHHNLPKDNCQFRCLDYPDGLTLKTRESQTFLVLNGIQTQSSKVYNLLDQIEQMENMGVDIARISPQSAYTEQVIDLFDQVRRRTLTAADGMADMQEWLPDQACNGYWLGKAGMEQHSAERQQLLEDARSE